MYQFFIEINNQISFSHLPILNFSLFQSCDPISDQLQISFDADMIPSSFLDLCLKSTPIRFILQAHESAPIPIFEGFISHLSYLKNKILLFCFDSFYLFQSIRLSLTLKNIYPLSLLKSSFDSLRILFYPSPSFQGKLLDYPLTFSNCPLNRVVSFLASYSNYLAFFIDSRFAFIPDYYVLSQSQIPLYHNDPGIFHYQTFISSDDSKKHSLFIQRSFDSNIKKSKVLLFHLPFQDPDLFLIHKVHTYSFEKNVYQDIFLMKYTSFS